MADKYNPQEIEPKWQQAWEEQGLYDTVEDPDKPKWYALTMLPYPSGDLHTGHWYAMTPSDAGARFERMNGYNVFFPIGFDAFGLPAENAAIKNGIHPKEWTYANIDRMREPAEAAWAPCGPGIARPSPATPSTTSGPSGSSCKFYDAGLAYRDFAPVDWCPSCNTTLAREQVWGDDRHCERCGTPVIKKDLNQWKFRITNYADELLEGLERIDWPERVKTMQTNWIGRSEGAEVTFRTEQGDPMVDLHHPARHAVGRDLHGAGPGASAGRQGDHDGPAAPRSRPTRNRPRRHGRDRSARPPTRRRPASSPAAMPSTRSTTSASPSGSPTT